MNDDSRPVQTPPCDETALRELYPPIPERSRLKELDRLDEHCRHFISLSPFLVIGSSRAGHGTDVSPRGDTPGFVRVLDDRTLALPDRPGNNRLDTLSNLMAEAEAALIFFVPGIDETLRVNGTAELSRDPALMAAATVNGKLPRMIVLIHVRQVYFHCGKALIRSRLWHQDYRVERKSFPSLGRILADQTKIPGLTVEQSEAQVERGYKENLY